MATPAGLVGHWPLSEDATDRSGSGNDGQVIDGTFGSVGVPSRRGVRFVKGGGIRVPHSPALDLGGRDFTISAWVHTEETLGDVLGDIASKFDPRTRHGFNFSLLNYSGVTSHHPNQRNIHFGIDDGRPPVIEDRGRPGQTVYVMALAVFNGDLYAGTFAADKEQRGRVYRYGGGTTWVDCGAPNEANAVSSLAVYNGHLYAGSALYKSRGSALSDSENTTPGGTVYRYDGDGRWSDCGRIDAADAFGYPDVAVDDIRSRHCDGVGMLTVFDGSLYAAPWYTEGVFRYDGGTTWEACGTPHRRLITMAAIDGHLVVAGHDGRPTAPGTDPNLSPLAETFRYSGSGTWSSDGSINGVTQIYSYAVYGDDLFAGAWPDGRVYRDAGGGNWIDSGRLGEELEVMAMAVYNGRLLAGTLPTGEVYSFDGDGGWDRIGRLDQTPDVKYRRVWSMAVFGGELFAGTLPAGHVHSIRLGDNVTYDAELQPGWRHLAARRRGGLLEMFIDGVSVAQIPADSSLDISSNAPLTIGTGRHATFRGALADVRIYDHGLTDTALTDLARSTT